MDFILKQRVARMATVDFEGNPHIVPICYAFDGKSFYTAVDDKPKHVPPGRLRRLQNIASKPNVAILIDEYHEDWERLAFVLVHGRASIVEDKNERSRAAELLRERYEQYCTVDLESPGRPIIRVDPYKVHSWRARD